VNVVLSKRARRDLADVVVRWQPQIAFTLELLETDTCPDAILDAFTPRGQVQVKPITVTLDTVPIVHRIKFVNPDSPGKLEDKPGIGPYRILYCVGRDLVYVMAIADKDIVDPYAMHFISELLIDYKAYRKRIRQSDKKRK